MSDPILELQNIGKRFGRETVLKDISLQLDEGQTLVLFGPSGAGKTVLLRLIAGVIEPDSGVVMIQGKDMFDAEPEERGIGMAFQNFALFPHMSAYDNIASPLTARKQSKERIRAGVESVARLLKIDHVLSHAPRELSNGQKQRTALARALAASPNILLLDDPLRNVDAKLRFEMRLELPRLLSEQGASVVYVTQDYKEAMALGDHIAVLSEGGIVQYGTPEDIYLRPGTLTIAKFFGDPTINLLDMTPVVSDSKISVQLSGTSYRIDDGYREYAGQSCVLGIRPEYIRFCGADDSGAVPVTVEAETPLNEKIVTLVITRGGRELLVSRPANTEGPASGDTYIALTPERVLLYSQTTGHRLKASDTAERVQ